MAIRLSWVVLCCHLLGQSHSYAQEPDRFYRASGVWKIHTMRYGIGCVAEWNGGQTPSMRMWGDTQSKFQIIISVDFQKFEAKLNDDEPVENVEVVIGEKRFHEGLQKDGYRGNHGLAFAVEKGIPKLGSNIALIV